jgi:hypothetical protein
MSVMAIPWVRYRGWGGARGLGGQDGGGERANVVAAVGTAAIDEEGRRAGHAAEVGGVNVLRDPGRAGVLAQVVAESRNVGADVAGVVNQVTGLEMILVGQEQVVHHRYRGVRTPGSGARQVTPVRRVRG